jgi:hypothetical protein
MLAKPKEAAKEEDLFAYLRRGVAWANFSRASRVTMWFGMLFNKHSQERFSGGTDLGLCFLGFRAAFRIFQTLNAGLSLKSYHRQHGLGLPRRLPFILTHSPSFRWLAVALPFALLARCCFLAMAPLTLSSGAGRLANNVSSMARASWTDRDPSSSSVSETGIQRLGRLSPSELGSSEGTGAKPVPSFLTCAPPGVGGSVWVDAGVALSVCI